MVAGWPFMCMRHTAQPVRATAARAWGSASAWISLIIEAPAASAAFITAGLRVSTDTQRSPIRSRTGSTRSSSSWSGSGAPPGRPAFELLRVGQRRRTGTARFAADIDDVGPFLRELPRMRDGRFRREEPAAVGERIGRNVHHAHHQGLVEREPEAPAPQKTRVVLLYAVGAGAVSPCAPPSLVGLEGFCEPPGGLGGRGGLAFID